MSIVEVRCVRFTQAAQAGTIARAIAGTVRTAETINRWRSDRVGSSAVSSPAARSAAVSARGKVAP